MDDAIRFVTVPFAEWADRVHACSSPVNPDLYESSHPFCSIACPASYFRLLRAMDRHHLGKECCKELLSDGVFTKLGEGAAADWEGVSARLAQRVGTLAQEPAWLQGDPQNPLKAVTERLSRACCANEVAVLMLRLAVRSACHASNWYGPWESRAALQQLVGVNAWWSLLNALEALLEALGPNLAKQYNALNIVSDILHVSRALHSLDRQDRLCTLCNRTSRILVYNNYGLPHACADCVLPERVALVLGLPAFGHE